MWITILLNVLGSEAIKTLIGLGVKKLVDHETDGITNDVAEIMLDGIARSRMNLVEPSMVEVALDIVKGVQDGMQNETQTA